MSKPHKMTTKSGSLPGIDLSYNCSGNSAPEVSWETSGDARLLKLRFAPEDGGAVSLESYEATIAVPQAGLHSVMVPNTRKIAHTLIYYHQHRKWPEDPKLYRCLIPEPFDEPAPANQEVPFILICDDRGNNAFAAGWLKGDVASQISCKPDGENYVVTLSRKDDIPLEGEVVEDVLFISDVSKPWINAERDYAMAFDVFNGRRHSPAPEWTSEPVFCTWYCYEDHIDQEGLLSISRKCAELGFGTILLDAGWDCFADSGFGDFENGVLGDYSAMPDRFPDLAGAIREIHDMGLKIELWCGPFWEGKNSRAYREKTTTWHMRSDEGECHELCPRHPGLRGHFRESFARVARTYDVDGMWIDAADGVQSVCKSDHPHLNQRMGEAFVDCLAAIRDGLRSVKPDAITEARVLHANLNTKRALDIIQPSDAPRSYEFLRLASIHLRPWTYDVVLKNDPMFWPPGSDDMSVSKYLATMVVNGVPALSVDFLSAPESQCSMTKAWLAFYKDHRQTLLKGEFRLFGADYASPDMMLIGDKEAVVYIKNPETRLVEIGKTVSRVIVLNCTDSDCIDLGVTPFSDPADVRVHGRDWSQVSKSKAKPAGAVLRLSCRVPVGGAVTMERE